MPILLFLIDTSASMNQRTDLGTSYLDIAKGAVELFLKAGWKENHTTFMTELKNLQATGLTTLGQALRSSFDLLNLNRLISGIDNYGQLHLPLNSPLPGSELTKEPFRWDQRLFALVLRLPGVGCMEPEQLGSVPTDESAITQMCEVTGGRSYCVKTQRMLNQCLESLVQKVQSGVVINFEKAGPDPLPVGEDGFMDSSRPSSSFAAQPWHSCHKLIYVRPNSKAGVPVGHWPIPESFWPGQNLPSLPPRTSHPVVRFSCVDCEPMVIDKLPFDKYELEPSPLTQYILERKSPHTCWQVFVTSSGKYNELGYPFGYLKASTTLTCVNLFVMPYNYPVLLPLLDDLFKVHKLKPNLKWRQAFDSYLKTLPPYYLLTKLESERVLASVGKKAPQEMGIKVKNHSGGNLSLAHNTNFRKLLKEITGETTLSLTELNTKEFSGFQVGLLNKNSKPQTYRNAYDIPRRDLLDELTRMRSNLLKTHKFIVGQDEDSLHSVPVAQMGNYQEYLKTLASPLREIDPDQPKRLHTFGNPFKQDKKGMMIDEADEFVAGPQNKLKRPGEPSPGSSKRRRSTSLLLRKPQTPPAVTNHVDEKGPLSASWTPSYPNLLKPTLVHSDATVVHDVQEEKMENGQTPSDGLLSKSAPAQRMNVAGDGLPSNQLDSLSDDCSSLRKDGLIHKAGNNVLVGGAQSCNLPVDNQNVIVPSTSETVPNKLQITPAMARGINADIKHQLMKEVRKFGRKYERIFTLLEEVQGPPEIQKQFVEFTIKEAASPRYLICTGTHRHTPTSRLVLCESVQRLLQEMMTDPDEFAELPDMDQKPVRDGDQPTPSKRMCTVSLQPLIQKGESEPHLEEQAKSKEEDDYVFGACVKQEAHEKTESDRTSPDTCLSECVPAELTGMEEGGAVALSLQNYQSDDSTSESKLGLPFSPSGASLDEGVHMRAVSAGDPVITAMPALPVVPHQLTMSPQEINADIKHQEMKEIRQFGRKYEGIFKLLDQVQGPLEVRKQFVEFTLKEAARFKRWDLISHLEKMLEKIVSDIQLIEDEDKQTSKGYSCFDSDQ
ncbi:Protein DDX26B [Fukomys damarensis]|uniref:Protein DDX26B n=1 Tax=Fukomys damarensis TaxID=885580 RepID=A0A091E406_FUKDA|nr:Protein DDX26B [Fukomys damarensis]